MMYKTHIAFAILPVVIIESIIDKMSIPFELLVYCAITVGALLPDLDEENSYIGKKLPIFPMIYQMIGVKHRGITHQFIFVVGLLILLQFLFANFNTSITEKVIAYSFVYGYLMHLVGDMLTKGGIDSFFYPLSNKKGVLLPRYFRFYTGSIVEYILFYLLSFLILVFFISSII